MFLGLEGSELQVIGWPWHGLIVDDELQLPSGQTMPCVHGSWDTQLWDIGMPDPEVAGTTPDEQWWNKAIIRGVESDSVIYSGWTPGSGARGAYRAPIRIGSELVRGLWLYSSGSRHDPAVTLSLSSGVGATINRSDLGIPAEPAYDIFSVILDSDFSRGRWIVVLRDSFFRDMAIVLVQLSPVGDSYEMTLSVIADYSEVAVFTSEEDNPLSVPPAQQGWYSGSRWVTLAEAPDYRGAIITTGEHTASARGYSIVNAWFGQGGAVERQRGWIESEIWYRCIDPQRFNWAADISARGRTWIENEATGSVSGGVSFEDALHLEATTSPSTSSYEHKIYLRDQLVDERFTFSDVNTLYPNIGVRVDSVPSWAGAAGQSVMDGLFNSLIFNSLSVYFRDNTIRGSIRGSRASNKLRQPLVSVVREDGSWVGVYGGAVHPHGVELKETEYDTRNGPLAATIPYGTYNPVTGEVVLNPTDGSYYSWV